MRGWLRRQGWSPWKGKGRWGRGVVRPDQVERAIEDRAPERLAPGIVANRWCALGRQVIEQVRDHGKLMRGGGSGANLAGIVYEPKLTLDLPAAETVGTSLNALAHTAEALYVKGRSKEGDREALAGAGANTMWETPEGVEEGVELRCMKFNHVAEYRGIPIEKSTLWLIFEDRRSASVRPVMPAPARRNSISWSAAREMSMPA